jgi:hypothetical protein
VVDDAQHGQRDAVEADQPGDHHPVDPVQADQGQRHHRRGEDRGCPQRPAEQGVHGGGEQVEVDAGDEHLRERARSSAR